MHTFQRPTNTDDIIDSRDVIMAIEQIQEELDELADAVSGERPDTDEYADLRDELQSLKAFADQGANNAPDWEYGEGCIRDSYFVEYAQQLADDIGAIDAKADWPLSYIDWDAAAEALKMDYTEIDFDGVTYWVR